MKCRVETILIDVLKFKNKISDFKNSEDEVDKMSTISSVQNWLSTFDLID
jgi:hypothetical protein